MRAILKLMRKQELMFKRITKLMREIIDLHDFSVDLQTLTGDLGAMELQLLQRYKCRNVVLKVCAVYYKSTIMNYCVVIFACYVRERLNARRCILQCGCRMELLAKTVKCKVDRSVMLRSRNLHSIFRIC